MAAFGPYHIWADAGELLIGIAGIVLLLCRKKKAKQGGINGRE